MIEGKWTVFPSMISNTVIASSKSLQMPPLPLPSCVRLCMKEAAADWRDS